MKILFIHQNFPGQFKYLAPALLKRGHEVRALSLTGVGVAEVDHTKYAIERGSTPNIHPWLVDFETQVIRAEGVLKAALKLKSEGYIPDVIVSHSGWGESLFLKDVWPNVPLGIYCEFFYNVDNSDINFDPEFYSYDPTAYAAISLKNLNNRLHFAVADAGISPTNWQKSTFPQPFKDRITVIHEGVDTNLFVPNPHVGLKLNLDLNLAKGEEVITFVNRNLEPHRGYHSFMRALPKILKERPRAHVLIVGGDGVSYGAKHADGLSWKDVFLQEVASELDLRRVHFLGNVSYDVFLAILQVSMVHVYLTYPFVLSWSFLEAMSAGCAIVASKTAPVEEVLTHNQTGRLVNFFSPEEISSQVIDLINNSNHREALGGAARQYAIDYFDRETICLPAQINWVERKFI